MIQKGPTQVSKETYNGFKRDLHYCRMTPDPPSPNRRSRPGLAQRGARHAHGAAPRKSGSPAGTRRHRGLCLGAGRRRPRAIAPCRSACPPIARGPSIFLFYSHPGGGADLLAGLGCALGG
jgi:hypothetical protein